MAFQEFPIQAGTLSGGEHQHHPISSKALRDKFHPAKLDTSRSNPTFERTAHFALTLPQDQKDPAEGQGDRFFSLDLPLALARWQLGALGMG